MPKSLRKRLALLGAVASLALAPGALQAQEDPIKVGVLHSLSGTMAISETTLKDVMLMLIEEQNANGGLLGRPIEAVVVDPASDWPLFAEKARELIEGEGVDVVFGCWTSVSRKSVLPVFEELNGLLFYPVQYEGEESSRNAFYTGAAPNQQAIPAVEYLMSEDGGGAERFVPLGTDYVYPRTTNKILRAFLNANDVGDEDILESYTPEICPDRTVRHPAPPFPVNQLLQGYAEPLGEGALVQARPAADLLDVNSPHDLELTALERFRHVRGNVGILGDLARAMSLSVIASTRRQSVFPLRALARASAADIRTVGIDVSPVRLSQRDDAVSITAQGETPGC